MSSYYHAKVPNYADPCVADGISSLISTALAVQEGLFNAREGLKRINSTRVNELLPRLLDIDERYLTLVNESRTSAAELYTAIQNFMDVAIPISQGAKIPMEKRVAIIKEFADKIAVSAQKDLQPYDTQIEALKENLKELLVDLTAIEATLKNQSKLTNDEQSVDTDDECSMTSERHLHCVVIVKCLSSIVGWFVAPNARRKAPVIAAPLETESAAGPVDEAVLKDISALVVLFTGLVGKLGHFGAVWAKLAADSAELSVYLSHGAGDLNVIDNRVHAEVGVYNKIKQALDDYCLRTE